MTKLLTRAAASAGSIDPEARTVDLVFATETPVARYSYDLGDYQEVLQISAAAIDTSRMDSMSLLDSHRNGSTANRLGTVVPGTLRIANGQAIVKVKFSRKPAADELFQDLIDGHTLPVSVGYSIQRLETDTSKTPPTATATRWTPMEISIVPIPADPNSKTRKEETVPEQSRTEITAAPGTAPLSREELQRRNDIRAIGQRMAGAGIDEAFVEEHLSRGTSLADFRSAMLDQLAERQERAPTFPVINGDRVSTERREFDAIQSALFARAAGGTVSDEGRPFMARSLAQIAEHVLERQGIRTFGFTKSELFERAFHTTSDFPILLTGTGERILREAYELNQSPLRQVLARVGNMTDLRKKTMVKVSDFGLLQQLSEAGEIKGTTRAEASEGYQLETYARRFDLSRKALINDDLGALAEMNRAFGRAAALTENVLVYSLLVSNPAMNEDGKALFHADHGNLAVAGSALDAANLSVARKAMRNTKAFGSDGYLTVIPKYLLVGPELETDAEKLLAAITAAKTSDANPFAGKLELLVEPQIQDKSWYVFADPAAYPIIEVSYLDGTNGPTVESQMMWDTLGASWRAYFDFGTGLTDWRGAYRNPGQ